jgi:hypothetical protein
MSDKITFVVYARIDSFVYKRIVVDKAEYDAVEDKKAYEQELLRTHLPDLLPCRGIYIEG